MTSGPPSAIMWAENCGVCASGLWTWGFKERFGFASVTKNCRHLASKGMPYGSNGGGGGRTLPIATAAVGVPAALSTFGVVSVVDEVTFFSGTEVGKGVLFFSKAN